jgi:HEAT repeat protein
MGLTFTSVCTKCGVEAPEVGDFGYIGSPSLDDRKRRGDLQTFGFIYAGLAAIGALTEEIEAFKAFLDEHGHHAIRQYNDLGEEDFGDEEQSDEGSSRTKKFRFKKRGFEDAFYELHCTDCDATHRSSSSERLAPFKPFTLTPAKIALFRSNAVSVDDESFYHVGGFPFDDLPHLDRFLTKHKGHALTARRSSGEASKAPEGLRRAAAPTPWQVPEWPPEANERALCPIADTAELRLLMKRHHRDPGVRRDSALQVGHLGRPGLLGYLVPLWLDPDPSVRAAAVAAAGSLKDPRSVRPLGQALLDESEEVRSAARAALQQLGVTEDQARGEARAPRGPYGSYKLDKTRAGIETALRDPRGPSYEALEALEKSREPWAVDLLLFALAGAAVGSTAARGLAKWKNRPEVAEFLIAALDDSYSTTVSYAVQALGKLKAEAAVPRIRELLLDSSNTSCWDTAEALQQIGSRAAAEALADGLGHPSHDVRSNVAWRLGVLKAGHLADRLVSALSDSAEEVRTATAGALEEMKDPSAAEALVRAYERPTEWDRRAAVSALATIGGSEALRVLVAALRDRSRHVRVAAASALEAANDPRGNRALLAAARRGDSVVALHSWHFLVGQGDPGTEQALAEALSDSDYETRDLVGCLLQCGNRRLEREARRSLEGTRPPRSSLKIRWGERPRPV